jgi:hypothetical protein
VLEEEYAGSLKERGLIREWQWEWEWYTVGEIDLFQIICDWELFVWYFWAGTVVGV